MSVHNLDHLFRPASIAVIGASPRPHSVGAVVMRNLLGGGFDGPILPVNPRHTAVAGVLAYADVSSLPLVPDLAVICTPARVVPEIVAALAARGTAAVVILTAGLAREGVADATVAAARASGMRLLGPNCVGLLVPAVKLNASFAHTDARPGSLAFVSQSGALCTTVLDWASSHDIGFSHFVSLGDAADVDFGDAIDWLGADPATKAILLYIESVADARKFLSASRAASRNKPIVAIKAGRVPAGERAAASHTGALAGADDVADYALRRAGILRVDDIDELFGAVETLAHAPPLHGQRLAIVTNGGGAGVMATDALVRGGGRLAELDAATIERLDAVLPAGWSRGNPVDIVGDAPAERFRAAVEIVAAAAGVDALLVLQAPTAVVDRIEAADAVIAAVRGQRKPVLTTWLGGGDAIAARRRFAQAGIATYETPKDAVRAFLQLTSYRQNRELLMQTPSSRPLEGSGDAARARQTVADVLADGRAWLTQDEARTVLEAFGIPTVAASLVPDAEAAMRAGEVLGFPVALKVQSPDVLHKSDVGGVVLDLESPAALRAAAEAMQQRLATLLPQARVDGFLVQRMARRPQARELFVGAAVDRVFGPFVVFGQGGVAVEVVADKSVALPPLNRVLARDFLQRTRVARLLAAYRDRPAADIEAVGDVLVSVAQMLVELPELVELDINPLLADADGVLALDARMRVERAAAGPATQRLAIRPYPRELEESWTLADGRAVLARPIRPEDEPAHLDLFRSFAPEDVRFRFFSLVREMPHSQLARYTQIDYDREMAFIAVDCGDRRELGVVRAVTDSANDTAEFAIIVRPEAKGQGLGRLLLEKMIRYCRERGTRTLLGRVLPDNRRMLQLAAALGFDARRDDDADDVEVRLRLAAD